MNVVRLLVRHADDALILAGGLTLAVGVALIDPRAGLIFLGVELVALGWIVRT